MNYCLRFLVQSGQTDGRTDRQTDRQTHRPTDRDTYEPTVQIAQVGPKMKQLDIEVSTPVNDTDMQLEMTDWQT